MYCKNCGALNAEGATFCTSCGTPLTSDAPEQPVQAQAPPPPPPAPVQYAAPPEYPQAAPPPGYPPQAYPPQQPGYPYPPQAPAPKKKKTGLIIGLSVAAVAILVVVLILVLGGGGGGGKSGIGGKWVVVDTEGSSDYEEGIIFNFKSNGTLTYEAPKGTPDELKGLYEMMNLLKTKYKTSGDRLTLTIEFFGEKDETEMRFTVEGDTLTLYDGSNATILKRSK
mgnify:CR=1 FL=1